MMFPLSLGEDKGEGKIRHKKSGSLQVIGFHLLVNILCNQNEKEPYLLSKQKGLLSFLIGNSISDLSEVNIWLFLQNCKD
jgi:hypothetical protein